MIMMGNRKNLVNQIVGPEGKNAGEETPLHTIASELIEAVNSHDVEAVIACFRSMLTHCQGESNEHVE